MKFLVDANVLSEPTRPSPDSKVLDWLRQHESEMAVDPVILGELRFGILLLPKGKRKDRLEEWFAQGVTRLRCLPWDISIGMRWAQLLADLRRVGKSMPIKDSLIASTALHHQLTIVTRNVRDFKNAGIAVLDPFA